MNDASRIVSGNIHCLELALHSLQQLEADILGKPYPPLFPSGVGGHLRHCIDHYDSFLKGLESGKVDYDARERDPRLENDRDYALQKLKRLIQQLENLDHLDARAPLLVKMDCGAREADPPDWCPSTVGRELQFLLSHTVHHQALMAVLMRLHGYEPEQELGVAPSTQRHLRSRAACVR